MNEPEKKIPEKVETVGYTFLSWFTTFLVWALLGLLIYIIKTEVAFAALVGALFLISYALHLLMMFRSPTIRHLANKVTETKLHTKMGEHFRSTPEITFDSLCYHYRDRKCYPQNGPSTIQVLTYREIFKLPYYSTKDVSGLFILNAGETKENSKPYVQLKLDAEINFADAISYSDYIYQKEAFWQRNRFRDLLMSFNEERTVPGLKNESLIKITDKEPPCISFCLYVLFSLLTFGQFYKTYVNSFCMFQRFKIRKLISTRYNLMNEEHLQQYSSLNPEVRMFQEQYSYVPRETGYTFEGNKYWAPTEDELENAQQYQQYVPNYPSQSVGGTVGIVQDIPQFQNVDYNQPPPAYANFRGDVELTVEQLQLRPQVELVPLRVQWILRVQRVSQRRNNVIGNQGDNARDVQITVTEETNSTQATL